MGQKVNPIAFRLSFANNWNSKYLEKKSTETAVYATRDLEIKNFIKKFFQSLGITTQAIQTNYSDNSLIICVSLFFSPRVSTIVNKLNKKQKIKFVLKQSLKYHFFKNKNRYFQKNQLSTKFLKKKKKIFLATQKIRHYNRLLYKKSVINFLKKKRVFKKAINFLKTDYNSKKFRRNFIQCTKRYLNLKKYNSYKNILHYKFSNKLLKSISTFINHKTNIFFYFKVLNQNLIANKINEKEKPNLTRTLTALQKYEQNSYFKEGVNLLFQSAYHKSSANLIAQFIAKNLKKLKKGHKFFLSFIKDALINFLYNYNKIKGIKIKIRGRLTKSSRSRGKIITIGNGTNLSDISSKIDYFEATGFGKNGTVGVKVWIQKT